MTEIQCEFCWRLDAVLLSIRGLFEAARLLWGEVRHAR